MDQFRPEERSKILYIGADVSDLIVDARSDSDLAHRKNERIMRGYFAGQVELKDSDIVFSVDADEIIFGDQYGPIIEVLESVRWPCTKSVRLPMYQFFYRINYLWEDLIITPAVACKAAAFKKYPAHWRGKGRVHATTVGCHFSWCLTVDEMMQKLEMYAHHHDYAHLAKREILEEAIRSRTYPFDPQRDFRIRVVDVQKEKQFYPPTLYCMLNEFHNVLG